MTGSRVRNGFGPKYSVTIRLNSGEPPGIRSIPLPGMVVNVTAPMRDPARKTAMSGFMVWRE
jgi:hypothetical protein